MEDVNLNLVFDIGMHLGADTEFYLKKGFNVIGFEANNELVEHCKRRFRAELSAKRLIIIEGAIAPPEFGGTITFFVNTKAEWGTIYPDWVERNRKLGYKSEGIFVERVDLYEAYRTYGVPYYMKIDIEGADKFVLETLTRLKVLPRYVSIEADKVDFCSLQAEIDLLRELGYSKFKAVQQERIPGSTVVTESISGQTFEHTFEIYSSGAFGDDIPQPWMTKDDIIEEYKAIFDRYRVFGDGSQFLKLPQALRRPIIAAFKLCTGYRGPLPGWFDTHASL